MNAQDLSKAGVLPIVAATMLFAASTVFAGDKSSMSSSVELKPTAVPQVKVDIKDLDEQVSHLEVIDSMGNAYLLIPLKTTAGSKPVVAADGKIIVEYVHPYKEPVNR